MYYLVYVSSATQPFSDAELDVLLARARRRNVQRGITGVLVHRGGNFIQYFEGEEQAVRDLYRALEADPRHRGLVVLAEGSIPARQFGAWMMDCRPGGRQVFSDDELRDDPEGVKGMINGFADSMR